MLVSCACLSVPPYVPLVLIVLIVIIHPKLSYPIKKGAKDLCKFLDRTWFWLGRYWCASVFIYDRVTSNAAALSIFFMYICNREPYPDMTSYGDSTLFLPKMRQPAIETTSSSQCIHTYTCLSFFCIGGPF